MVPRVRLLVALVLLSPVVAASQPARGIGHATGNGRAHWVLSTPFGDGTAIAALRFVDPLDGWAVGSGGSLFGTRDGGAHWSQVVTGVPDTLRAVAAADPSRLYVAGDSSVLVSSDGGVSWYRMASPAAPEGITDLATVGTRLVLAAAGPSGGLYGSDDGGVSWRRTLIPQADPAYTHLGVGSSGTVWACGPAGLVRNTSDGAAWQSVDLHLTSYQVVAAPSAGAIAVGGIVRTAGGKWSTAIAISRDDGLSWTTGTLRPVSSPEEASVRALAFSADGASGSVATGSGLFQTDDGGTGWHRRSLPRADGTAVTAIAYGGRDALVVAGGVLLHDGPLPDAIPPGTYAVGGTPRPTAATAVATPVAAAFPSATPADMGDVPFPTATPANAAPFASATPPPLQLHSVSPASVIAGNPATLTIRGSGFDDLVTVTVGPEDIARVSRAGETLRLALPRTLRPGRYDVVAIEPDGRSARMQGALTIVPRLLLVARLLRSQVSRGSAAIVLVQTLPEATIGVRIVPVPGMHGSLVHVEAQRGPRGEWRILLAVSPVAVPGTVGIVLDARQGDQRAHRILLLTVTR